MQGGEEEARWEEVPREKRKLGSVAGLAEGALMELLAYPPASSGKCSSSRHLHLTMAHFSHGSLPGPFL